MRRFGWGQLALMVAVSLAAWGIIAGACLSVGSTGMNWPTSDQFAVRLESVLMASLVGAALGMAGATYQAILRNPLADPYLLGISSGATLASYLWRVRLGAVIGVGLFQSAALALGQQGFAVVGALAAVGIVFLLASRRGRIEPITLLLVGVIVNAVNGAIFLLLNALVRDMPASGGAFAFIVGGLQTNLTQTQEAMTAVVTAIGWLILMAMAGKLNVAGLGDAEAVSLGVNIHLLRWTALVVASIVTAAAVAVSGPIGFVGLVCPHLARLMVGGDQRKVLPLATALGAGLLVVADAAARLLSREGLAETMLPVGVLTGLLGGPFFLLLLWQNRRRIASAEGL